MVMAVRVGNREKSCIVMMAVIWNNASLTGAFAVKMQDWTNKNIRAIIATIT